METISKQLLHRTDDGYEYVREMTRMEFEVAPLPCTEPDEVTETLVDALEDVNGRISTLEVVYAPDGGYVGTTDKADWFLKERGIKPELSSPEGRVCSIGFCDAEQKWYGWSHRAIYGFGVGSEAKEGDLCTMSGYIDGYLEEHPEKDRRVPVGFKAETLEDAKRMAVAFADSVS